MLSHIIGIVNGVGESQSSGNKFSIRRGNIRACVLLSILLIFVLIVMPLGRWIVGRQQQASEDRTKFKRSITARMHNSFSRLTIDCLEIQKKFEQDRPPLRRLGKLVVLGEDGEVERAHFLLPERLQATEPNEVETVCWVINRDSHFWQGARGFDAVFVDRKTGKPWDILSYEGSGILYDPEHPQLTHDPIDGQEFDVRDRSLLGLIEKLDAEATAYLGP